MDVFISDIPDEGLHLEGDLPPTIFALDPADVIRPAGPVSYVADIYAFEEVIVVNGHLTGPFQLQCGACLEYFDFAADFPSWSSEIDRDPGQTKFDLAEIVREDFLLNLPAHPRCDEFNEDRICPKADLVEEFLEREDVGKQDEPKPDIWGALDDWKSS